MFASLHPSLNPTIYPASSQLIICAQGGNCGKKRFAPVPTEALLEAWQDDYLWRVCHLSFSDCLGPCHLANMACFMSSRENRWLHRLVTEDYQHFIDWAQASKQAHRLLPFPDALQAKITKRFFEPQDISFERPQRKNAG